MTPMYHSFLIVRMIMITMIHLILQRFRTLTHAMLVVMALWPLASCRTSIIFMSQAHFVPDSLQTEPICKLVPPGNCQLTDEWQALKLIARYRVSPTSSLLRFQLPETNLPLQLSTCACILAKTPTTGDTQQVIRPYTPISTNALKGCFDLLIKDYGVRSQMSHTLCTRMNIGDSILFRHAAANVKVQAPFGQKKIYMLAGGTGITPMIQALHAILGKSDHHQNQGQHQQQQVVLLYGSKSSEDILAKELLDSWAQKFPHRFSIEYILSEEPTSSNWKGARGYIDRSMLEKYLTTDDGDNDVLIMVCGPPLFYEAICGPRDNKDQVTGILGQLGYLPFQVYKF